MGFFTSSSKFFMYLLTSIFELLGLAVLAAGLYLCLKGNTLKMISGVELCRLTS